MRIHVGSHPGLFRVAQYCKNCLQYVDDGLWRQIVCRLVANRCEARTSNTCVADFAKTGKIWIRRKLSPCLAVDGDSCGATSFLHASTASESKGLKSHPVFV